MKAGMILRSKQLVRNDHSWPINDRRWFIKKEGEIKRQNRLGLFIVKGYRIAPLENLDQDFWVTEGQLHERFEEAV